jgi:hypothetical protein
LDALTLVAEILMKTSVGILSWKAHETLRKSLCAHQLANLQKNFDEAIIHFNARSPEDDVIAQEFGWDAFGDERNLGLLEGMEQLAKEMSGDILLLLQNDCPVCVSASETAAYLQKAQALILSGRADIVRCRHRWNVGQGFSDCGNYLKYYHRGGKKTLKGWLRPFKATRMIGRSPYVEECPEKIFPKYIHREGDFLIVDSAVINFTDQPFMIRKSLFLELCQYAKANPKRRTLNGFQVLELNLNCAWWRNRHYRIAVGEGCFTHNRFDDSFREDHAAFNKEITN